MAPIRRRLSKRVVKTTFDDCFEYDIPGFRSLESKRQSLLMPRSRASMFPMKPKSKEESTPKTAKISSVKNTHRAVQKTKTNKDSMAGKNNNKLSVKTSEDKTKVQTPIISHKKKTDVKDSDNKSFRSSQPKTKVENVISAKRIQEPVKSLDLKRLTPDDNIDSKNWQPRVHLEKLSLSIPIPYRSAAGDTEGSPKMKRVQVTSSRSTDLAIRLRNALKDPMAERDDNETGSLDIEISNLDEILTLPAGIQSGSGLQRQVSEDTAHEQVAGLKNNIVREVFQENRLCKQPGSDSALEDWPESSSEASDAEDIEPGLLNVITSPSVDWTGSQVSLLLKFQQDFKTMSEELRNSFDNLKSIISEKNSVITALRKRLTRFTDSTIHQILDRVLLDYDKLDPKKPATVIVNSILEYEDLQS